MKKIFLGLLVVASFLFATSEKDFFDVKVCDQIVDKDIYSVCYSYKHKGGLIGWTKINGALAVKEGIKDRPYFHEENSIPKEYRVYYKDYTGYGKDWNRGHGFVADADVDYDLETLNKSYSMVNVLPMGAKLNQKTWVKLERYGRLVASKLGYVNSITIADYNNSKVSFKGITVPSGFYRVLYNDEKDFKKCFYYENTLDVDVEKDDLRDHEIACNSIKKITSK